jgi:C1A family cysteine protease
VAALEARIAAKGWGRVNLSEQSLYWYYKYYLVGDSYGTSSDGASPSTMLKGTDYGNYIFQWEKNWNYNPSTSRIGWNVLGKQYYLNSCDEYGGEECHDNTHQGPTPTSSGDVPYEYDGFLNSGAAVLWSESNPDLSLALATTFVNAEIPVIATIKSSRAFQSPDNNGFIIYDKNDSAKTNSGHVILLIGFVAENDLPAEVEAPDVDAGGGYFIVKNSWGTTWGDNGFIYLPLSWMKKWTSGLVATDVESQVN